MVRLHEPLQEVHLVEADPQKEPGPSRGAITLRPPER